MKRSGLATAAMLLLLIVAAVVLLGGDDGPPGARSDTAAAASLARGSGAEDRTRGHEHRRGGLGRKHERSARSTENRRTRSRSASPLASSALRRAVERLSHRKSPPRGVTVVGGRILVEVLHRDSADPAAVDARVRELGGAVRGHAGDHLTQALVPARRLADLARATDVGFIRPPLRVDIAAADGATRPGAATVASSFPGEEVAKTNAAAWHAAGRTGAGVKIGIVDGFDGGVWSAAAAAGRVPSPAGTFCRWGGSPCDVWGGGTEHGTGVAEIVHEMAPGAQVYLATAIDTADLQAAVDYFASQGVRVISRSLTSAYDGAGNGTGPIANVIDSAVAKGMLWVNSAGNSAGSVAAGIDGTYWRGPWTDSNRNGWLEFAQGDEYLEVDCGFLNGVRWSDWDANPTDYDVEVVDAFEQVVARSEDDQAAGALPLEHPDFDCNPDEPYYLSIGLYGTGNGTSGDTLEVMGNGAGFGYWQSPYSASGPAADSASAGALAVGAVDPPLGTAIAAYSSQGPTNDGRVKPDLSAAACVKSFAYAPDCFNGTSSAAPATAGAAALVIGTAPAFTPAQVKSYLRGATVDRGTVGPDNVYGAGELRLPNLTADPDTTITAGPAGVIHNHQPSFRFSSSKAGSTFQCKLDGAAWQTCGSPKTYPNVPDGLHAFSVRARDAAGRLDPTPALRYFSIDTTPPVIRITAASPQHFASTARVRFSVVCTSEPCRQTVTLRYQQGTHRYPYSPGTASSAKGQPVTWTVPATGAYKTAVMTALNQGKLVTLEGSVAVQDALGNKVTKPIRIRVIR